MYSLSNLKSKDFSLVFSGGSALGFAHLGSIKYLEENNLVAEEVLGTSMGSLIGSAYAIGLDYSQIYDLLEDLNFLKLFSPDFSFSALIGVSQIKKYLKGIFGDMKISQTKIPLKIVATNFDSGELVIFDKENDILLIDAICASFSIPGIFKSYKINSIEYVDGFLTSNLPLFFSKNKNILAINVINSSLLSSKDNVYLKSFIISILNQNKDKVTSLKNKNLFLIEPNLSKFSVYDFFRWKKISVCGYESCKNSFE